MPFLEALEPLRALGMAGGGWSMISARLEAMRNLADDWDGEGSVAPPDDVVDAASDLLARLRDSGLSCPLSTNAGPNGSVVLMWYSEGWYFEIDITAPSQADWFSARPGAIGTGGTIDLEVR